MLKSEKIKIDEFLNEYKFVSIKPSIDDNLILEGRVDFHCTFNNSEPISDNFYIRILVPRNFPNVLPEVSEINRKIPKRKEFHINDDGTLCLGSPIRLLKILKNQPTITAFTQKCIIPHLYSCSVKLKNGGKFVVGELAHGFNGLLDDYKELFNLGKATQVMKAIIALSTKKRIANKRPCPCGCGKRLGVCRFHYLINDFRKIASRSWYNLHHIEIMKEINESISKEKMKKNDP